jgi:diacylglycerol kinase (ATP)
MKSRKFSIPARLRSFRFAFRGVWWLIREEHNSWIHLAVVAVLIPVCFLLGLSAIEWTVIAVCTGLVLALELVNSAIERLADKISPEQDPDIGKIKDIAAAAVLVAAIASAVSGLIILVPKFLHWIQS